MQFVKASAAVAVFVGLMLTVASIQAAPARSVKGQLVFETPGVSCNPCRVSLMRSAGQPVGFTVTDSAGNFTFDNVEPGSYMLRIEIDGFEKIDQEFNFIDNLGGGGTATVLVAPRRLSSAATAEGPAIIDASEYLTAYPKKAVELYKKGIDNKKKGKDEQATKFFEQAIEVAPNFYAAHNALGMQYRDAGRKDDAEKEFLKAHDLNKNDAEPLINLTGLYIDKNEPGRAVETGEQAVKANSHSAPAFFSLGIALYKFAQLDRAEAALMKALELAPKMFQARLMLANVYLKEQRYDNLMDQLDRYLAENPNGEQRQAVEEMRRTLLQARETGTDVTAQ
jgi:tetratricopeptide (TPR) repeat protein